MKKHHLISLLLFLMCLCTLSIPQSNAEFIEDKPNKLMEEKWEGLEDSAKNEIYSLLQKRAEAEIDLLEKLSEYKLLDSDLCRNIIDKLQKETAKIKDTGNIPDFLRRPHALKEKKN